MIRGTAATAAFSGSAGFQPAPRPLAQAGSLRYPAASRSAAATSAMTARTSSIVSVGKVGKNLLRRCAFCQRCNDRSHGHARAADHRLPAHDRWIANDVILEVAVFGRDDHNETYAPDRCR
jgi:hypothetical protein